jgi:serine protease inhibitor
MSFSKGSWSRRLATWIATLSLVLATSACAAAPSATPTPAISGQEKYLTVKVDPVYPLAAGTNALDPAYVASLRTLGGGLLSALMEKHPGTNQMLSPLGVSMAFTMTAAGAAGDTLTEMLGALGYQGMDLATAVAQNRLAFENLYRDEPTLQVALANSLWCLDDYPFRQEFLDSSAKDFFASIRAVRRVEGADPLALINAWASERTKGLVPQVLDEIEPNVVLILVNALYFKGEWINPFGSDRTRSGTFTKRDGTTVATDFLWKNDELRVHETDGALSIAIPYKGGMALVVTMPKGDASFDATQRALLGETLDWTGWTSQDLDLGLPTFSFDAEIDLPASMEALGMKKAFVVGAADFSGMSPRALEDDMYIAAAVQKSFITLTEKGTEAGAATAVSLGVKGIPRQVAFDRPFWFAIVDGQGVPLFLGTVEDPSQH